MSDDQQASPKIAAGQEWRISRFTPEDAAGVVGLFRSVYGDGYPVRTYMETDLLIRENRAVRTVSSVARTAGGDIVGHNALFNSAPNPGIYESGAGVVHAAYRGGKGIFTGLVAHGLEIAKEMENVEAVFGEPVCNHPFSQKLMPKMGMFECALEVDLMPAAAYVKEASAGGRVAAFLAFTVLQPKKQTLFLPRVYDEDLRFFYESLKDQQDFTVSQAPLPAEKVTDLRPQLFPYAAVARIAVYDIGADFEKCLLEIEEDLQQQGILVTQFWLRLDCPWIGAAVDILRERGYFLGGVLPRWFDCDGMLMQKIAKQPDWDGICTVTGRGAEILARVHADWQSRK